MSDVNFADLVPQQPYGKKSDGQPAAESGAAAPSPDQSELLQDAPPDLHEHIEHLGEHLKSLLKRLVPGAAAPAAKPSPTWAPIVAGIDHNDDREPAEGATPAQPFDQDISGVKTATAGQISVPVNQQTQLAAQLDHRDAGKAPAGGFSDPSKADPFHHMLASLAGIPLSVARAFGDIESQNKPSLAPNKFGYTGLYQQGRENVPAGWHGDLRDPSFNATVTAHTLKTNGDFFRSALGRDPDPAEMYMMHNQGLVGGTALVQAAEKDPNLPAYQALAKYAPLVGGRKMSEGTALAHIKENMWGDLSRNDPQTVTAAQWVASVRAGVDKRLTYYGQLPETAAPSDAVQVPSRRLGGSFLQAAPSRPPSGKQPFVPADRQAGGI